MQYSTLPYVESVTELRSLAHARQREGCVEVALEPCRRRHPAVLPVMGGKPTPFGLDEQGLASALQLLREEPSLELKGLHFHMLSHQLDVDAHLALIRSYFLTFRQLCVDHDLQLACAECRRRHGHQSVRTRRSRSTGQGFVRGSRGC